MFRGRNNGQAQQQAQEQAQEQAQQMQLYPGMLQARIRTDQEVNNYQEQSEISSKDSQDIFRPVYKGKEVDVNKMYKPRVSEKKDDLDLTNTNEALMPSSYFANYISKKVAASRDKLSQR